jgi:hypothetical protein
MTEAHPSLEIQNAAGFRTNNQIDKLIPDEPEVPGIGQWLTNHSKTSAGIFRYVRNQFVYLVVGQKASSILNL